MRRTDVGDIAADDGVGGGFRVGAVLGFRGDRDDVGGRAADLNVGRTSGSAAWSTESLLTTTSWVAVKGSMPLVGACAAVEEAGGWSAISAVLESIGGRSTA
jgi:hypothetical protein